MLIIIVYGMYTWTVIAIIFSLSNKMLTYKLLVLYAIISKDPNTSKN